MAHRESGAGALRAMKYFTQADVDQQCLGNSAATEQNRRSPLRASLNCRGDGRRRPVGSRVRACYADIPVDVDHGGRCSTGDVQTSGKNPSSLCSNCTFEPPGCAPVSERTPRSARRLDLAPISSLSPVHGRVDDGRGDLDPASSHYPT